jgi:hypothetical protein
LEQVHKTIFFVLAGVSATQDHITTPVRKKVGSWMGRWVSWAEIAQITELLSVLSSGQVPEVVLHP